MRLDELLRWAISELSSSLERSISTAGLPANSEHSNAELAVGNAKLDAQVLLAFALQKSRTFLIAFPEFEPEDNIATKFKDMVFRRCKGEPVAYILGEREFWSLPLYTNESTLIPRPDTECLVELVLSKAGMQQSSVVDLGTGTGAIALALAKECPGWRVLGIDYSLDAVLLAKKNATRNKLAVTFEQGDWLENIQPNSLDIIVSNPPYIDEQDPHLEFGDLRFEPLSALVSPGNGYEDFKKIAAQSLGCLKPSGWLFLEHGYEQQETLIELLRNLGYVDITGHTDYAGQPRNISARAPFLRVTSSTK